MDAIAGVLKMITKLPLPPAGIYRDQTEHGKIYFSRRHLIAYGEKCFEAGRSSITAAEIKYTDKETVEFFRGFMGIKK
ncbi:MAG: hypothetical protein ACOYNF_01730 [Rhodoferax sp.]